MNIHTASSSKSNIIQRFDNVTIISDFPLIRLATTGHRYSNRAGVKRRTFKFHVLTTIQIKQFVGRNYSSRTLHRSPAILINRRNNNVNNCVTRFCVFFFVFFFSFFPILNCSCTNE